MAFGGFDVQVLSRARREGEARAPDPGELGWKDTLRVDPLESVLIAVRPVLAEVPFKLPASARSLDITLPAGRPGRVHAAGPPHRAPALSRGRQRAGGPQLRGLLEHPPHGRAGEPHRPPPGAPGHARSARRADRDRGGDGRVELAWTAPLFPPPVIGYVVERATDEGFAGEATTFTAAGDGDAVR